MESKAVWVAQKMGGNCPQLTGLSRTCQDPVTGMIYVYGGIAPGDKRELPTPYFHVCDTKTMKFTDLTNSLTFVTPGDPWAKREIRPLPSLSEAGFTFLEVNGHPMIFLFGGHDAGDDDKPSSALVAINTKYKEWFYVEFEDDKLPPPAARINPTLVGANNTLYIFGGFKQFGDNWNHYRSYSIIQLQKGTHKCKWLAIDAPYPNNVPVGQVFGRGLSIYNGTMILLFPGRENEDSKIRFEKDNFFYFLTINNSFEKAKLKGDLPKDIHWYFACSVDPVPPVGLSSSTSSSHSKPSILMCTWIPHDPKYLVPELWQYFVYPEDKVVRLGIGQRVFDLDKDFQRFALVGNRAFLMGGEGGEESTKDKGAMCDIYVEIPMQTLLKVEAN